MLCLHESRPGLIQRLDLPTRGKEAEVVDAPVPPLVREHPDGVLLVGYEATTGESMPVLNALEEALRSSGVVLKDRLVVQ